MNNSPFDSVVALFGGILLLALVALATMGTLQRSAGASLLPSPTPEPLAAFTLPSITTLPVTPTISATPTEVRPPTETPLPTRTPRPTRTPNPTLTAEALAAAALSPSRTPLPSATLTPTPTPRPTPRASDHYWFVRPIPSGENDSPDRYYPYASTGEGSYAVHHGVEFINATGVPVLAAGAGTVVVALNDAARLLGPREWSLQDDGAFYGNVVVIQHDQAYQGDAVFTLYGHLDTILTREGARVEAGDPIGAVGMSGIALGPHLHFEVRVGENSYNHTRNPQLWLVPYAEHGTIIGRVLDEQGRTLPAALITLHRLDDNKVFRSTFSYELDPSNPTYPDDEWGENFLLGDVPAGTWLVAAEIGDDTVVGIVTVEPGKSAWLWLEP